MRKASVAPPAELSSETLENSHRTDMETLRNPQRNYRRKRRRTFCRSARPAKPSRQSLTPVENSAFNELARQLSARLETENGQRAPPVTGVDETAVEPASATARRPCEKPAAEPPEWLAPPEPPARGEAARDKALLDLLPVGILIYRLDRLLYANPAFLTQMGYPSLHALEDAGGLDALYVEPGVSNASSTSDTGTPVTISASQPRTQMHRHRPPTPASTRFHGTAIPPSR